MNKEQIRHWMEVLKEVAVAQFLFFGGKNLYLYSSVNDFDAVILGFSSAIYLVIHVIVHLVLSEVEE